MPAHTLCLLNHHYVQQTPNLDAHLLLQRVRNQREAMISNRQRQHVSLGQKISCHGYDPQLKVTSE